jgi:hypothetical protein
MSVTRSTRTTYGATQKESQKESTNERYKEQSHHLLDASAYTDGWHTELMAAMTKTEKTVT